LKAGEFVVVFRNVPNSTAEHRATLPEWYVLEMEFLPCIIHNLFSKEGGIANSQETIVTGGNRQIESKQGIFTGRFGM